MKKKSVFYLCIIFVFSLAIMAIAEDLQENVPKDGVEVRMIPISTSTENGIVTMVTKLRLINKTGVDVRDVLLSSSAGAQVQVSPSSLYTDYLAAGSEIVIEELITIVSPESGGQEDPVDHGLTWTVDYQVVESVAAVDAVPEVLSSVAETKKGNKLQDGVYLNEVMFYPTDPNSEHEWVELSNKSDEAISIGGYQLCNASGVVYSVSSEMSPVPSGAFVLIVFDGKDAAENDLSFEEDNLVTLHASIKNVFVDEGDVCALFKDKSRSKGSIRGFVTWSDIDESAMYADSAKRAEKAKEFLKIAKAKKLWKKNITILIIKHPKEPIHTIAPLLSPGGSIGLYPEKGDDRPADWVIYRKAETTPGDKNAVPAPDWRSPQSGAVTTDRQITFGWTYVKNAKSYWLQIDNDPIFGSPEIDIRLPDIVYKPETPLPDDTYYWRVKAIDDTDTESTWSEVVTIVIDGTDTTSTWSETEKIFAVSDPNHDLGITSQLQHKDTAMLCLDGCSQTESHPWDDEHTNNGCLHDNWYCCRAAISIISFYFGGSLSQDRISYHGFGTGSPEDDLGHGQGMWPNEPGVGTNGNNALSWALKDATIHKQMGKPTFEQIKQWLDANRPILAVIPSGTGTHCVVLDGYTVAGTLIHVIDPGTNSESPFDYNTYNFERVYVPPAGSNARSDEASLSQDSDGDDMMDFDEDERFHTDKNFFDTDNDFVDDKTDVASYVFRGIDPDVDGDGLRGELDDDSDDGGVIDGEEDLDRDGKYEAGDGETDPHDPTDDEQKLDLIFCIDTTGSMWDDIDAVKAASIAIINQIATDTPNFRIAVVDFRDFPVDPYGGSGDYAYHDVCSFTNNKNVAINAIQSLSIGWGNDWPESVYSGLMHCIESTSLGGWRGQPIKKAIIVMGDAPPHDPEPFTGYTMAQVNQAAEDADPVIIYPVVIGGDSTAKAYFTGLAEGTGGEVFTASNASEVVEAILEAIAVITYSPFAEAGGPYTSEVGQSVLFDTTGSFDPDGEIVLYEWDWNNDGTYDQDTTSPTCEHTWSSPYEGRVRLRVTDNDDLSSIDTADVSIGGVTNQPPIADAGPDQDVECACNTEQGTRVTLDGIGSSDPNGDPLTYTWTGPFDESPANGATRTVTLSDGCPGDYVITLVVNDGEEDSLPDDVIITVEDTIAPEISVSVEPNILWPPNHKMVKISSLVSASDGCDADVSITLLSITMNEGEETNTYDPGYDDTQGDGHTTDDIQVDGGGNIYVRAERSGKGDGRVYTIVYEAEDASGNTTQGTATVTVPHSQP